MENEQLFKNYLDQLKLEGKRRSTIEEYERRLIKFFSYFESLDKANLQEVDRRDVLNFKQELLQSGLSFRSINGVLSTLSSFFGWLETEGLIEVTPVPAKLHLKPVNKPIERVSDDNLRTFLAWANTLQENLRAAFWLMYGSGARVGEVAKLEFTDIRMIDGRVFINITDAKWGSDRNVPIVDQEAARIVWDYHESCSITGEPIFRVSRRTLQTYATKFSNQTGITFHCHLLRHTFASRLLEQKVPITTIQYLLGHKTVQMTAHYTQSAIIDVSSIVPTVFQERGNASEAGDLFGN